MDTFIGRAQNSFGKFSYATSVAFLLVAILGVGQMWLDGAFRLTSSIGSVRPTMRWQDSWRYGAVNNRRKENARFEFDLEADLTKLFNWNTKQVFAYVTVDYESESPKSGAKNYNSVVVWDRIIVNKDQAKLNLKNVRSKYSVWDIQQKFGGTKRELQLNLRWNVQPHVGFLINGETKIEGGALKLPEAQEIRKANAKKV